MYNNTIEQPLGRIMLYVGWNRVEHHLKFFIVNSKVTPILGRDSLVQILDSYTLHKVSDDSNLPQENYEEF